MTCCAHKEGANPRMHGRCIKCGMAYVKDPSGTTRDLQFEQEMLDTAIELCHRVYGRLPTAYTREVQSRLALGAERYGDGDYLLKDNLQEATQESPDFAAYHLLELQRVRPLMSEDEFEEMKMLVLDAMAHTAAAHLLSVEVSRLRHDILGE